MIYNRAYELKLLANLHIMRSDMLNIFFKAISFLGEEIFYIIVFPIIWHIKGWKFGTKFIFTLIIGAIINFLLKDIFNINRPFLDNPNLGLVYVKGGSFPSAHAQLAILFWGMLALEVNRKLFYYFTIVLVIFICISRLYLGVHFPIDIIGGLFIGGLMLLYYNKYIIPTDNLFNIFYIWFGMIICILSTLIIANSRIDKDIISLSGELCGVFISNIWNLNKPISYENRLASYVASIIALLGSLIIYKIIFKLIFPSFLTFFLEYMFIAIWVCYVSGWCSNKIFKKFRMINRI